MFPLKKIGTIIFVFLVLMTLVLLKGSSSGKSVIGVTCGTWQFWLILTSGIPFSFLVTLYTATKLRKEQIAKEKLSFNFLVIISFKKKKIIDAYTHFYPQFFVQAEDIKYTIKFVTLLPLVAVFAGMLAGFLGIGAGMIVAPVMLELGVIPQVAAATSAFTVIFTAGSTSTQFIVLGRLQWQLALWFSSVGFLASIFGQLLIAYFVKKYRKQSIINFVIGFAIVISAIALVSVQVVSLVHQFQTGQIPDFEGICSGKIN